MLPIFSVIHTCKNPIFLCLHLPIRTQRPELNRSTLHSHVAELRSYMNADLRLRSIILFEFVNECGFKIRIDYPYCVRVWMWIKESFRPSSLRSCVNTVSKSRLSIRFAFVYKCRLMIHFDLPICVRV